jgi:colanic acid biosynthesis glycosyl transferase WcaI
LNILLLNQAFYPDVVSTAQHLTELACALSERGHQVTVLTSRRAYDDPKSLFATSENWRGVGIRRVCGTGFGKATRWGRALDCISFLAVACFRLPWFKRQDLVLALTSPPFISLLGLGLARLHGCPFVHWVMDLNPDEAVAVGWLKGDSIWTRALEISSRLSLQAADEVIALDNCMSDRIQAKGVVPSRIAVLPPWAHDSHSRFSREGRRQFRREHRLDGQFVVMYSGNHSPCHPLGTVLDAARELSNERAITLCFVGGGSEFRKIQKQAERNPVGFRNIRCIPYQPLEKLSDSLSAADAHLVVMGDEMVGLVHPCKIYNLLHVGLPILYVGPRGSPTAQLVAATPGSACFGHGDSRGLAQHILQLREQSATEQDVRPFPLASRFSKRAILPKFVALLEQHNPERLRSEVIDVPPVSGRTCRGGYHLGH